MDHVGPHQHDGEREREPAGRHRGPDGHQPTDIPVVGAVGDPGPVGTDRHDDEVVREDHQQDQERRRHEEPRHDERDREQDDLLDRLRDLVQHPRQHAAVDPSARLHRPDDARETGTGEHQLGRGLGHVGRVRDGDADLRLLERRRVVHPVAGHADDLAVALERLDEAELVLRVDPGEPREARRGPGEVLPAPHRSRQPQRGRDRPGGRERVPGDHDHPDPHRLELADERAGVLPDRVGHRDHPHEPQRSLRTRADRQDPVAFGPASFEPVVRSRRGGDQVRDHRRLPEEDAPLLRPVSDARFGPLARRLEGHELRAFVRGYGPVLRGRKDREIDRVLRRLVTRGRGEGQELVLRPGDERA